MTKLEFLDKIKESYMEISVLFKVFFERLVVCWYVLTKKNYVFFALDNDAIVFDANGNYSDINANKLAEFDCFDENFDINTTYGIKNIGWLIWGAIADFAYKRIIQDYD